MKNNPFRFLLTCTVFTVIGLVGGFMAASQKKGNESTHGDHGSKEEDHSGHDHGNEHSSEKPLVLSAQALKNLKVRVKEVELKNYSTYRPITARIESTPKTVQPILAPIGGTIKNIDVEHGQLVERSALLITLMRDAIPRPELKITKSLLDPEQRIKGLSIDEISNIEKKTGEKKQAYIWKNTLKRFGYWTKNAEKTLNSLPSQIQNLPFSVAVIGEISANGYLDDELVKWITTDKEARNNFLEIASFILGGESLSFIQNMSKLGALNSLVKIKVPEISKDYDVHEIFVKPGDHVEMGEVLGELHDLRELHIEAHARGSEIPILMKALEDDLKISAAPLIKNSGVVLKNLKIQNVLDDGKNGALVHLEIFKNPSVVKAGEGGKKYRSWKIRAGSRYVIKVPQENFENVFILPSNAVVEDGAEKIIFVQDGDTYKSANVVVLYQNNEVVLLSQDSDIFPGDHVVVHGSFGLGLALKAQTGGAVDPHAGHSH